MDKHDLLTDLRGSDDNEVWARVIAQYFERHELYYGHGTDNAFDEAWWLLRHLQNWETDAWDSPADQSLAEDVISLALERVRTRRPLAYLLGEAWFCGLQFAVDERVLVPRSPFAEIIERCFEPWIEPAVGDCLLDIGTGSGCIAIAAALYCPETIVDATDSSAGALEVARTNVARHALEDRVRLHEVSLFPRGDTRYRVIMANPPYVPEADYATLPQEYLHEPREGLVGGPTGLEPAWSILSGCASRLTDDGIVILEVGNEAQQLEAQAPELAPIWVEFERGGQGVCIVLARQLREYLSRRQFPTGIG